MKFTALVGAMAFTALVAGNTSAPLAAQDREVTLVGCAVKGTGDGDGFLLANSVEQTTRTVVAPTPSGTAVATSTTNEMKPARMLYWLDDDDDEVAKMMGQLVEVTGEVEGDIERGKIEVEREDGMIELEINADGRKANVKLQDVPSAIGTSGSVKDREVELPYVVRKLDVTSARSLAPTCR